MVKNESMLQKKNLFLLPRVLFTRIVFHMLLLYYQEFYSHKSYLTCLLFFLYMFSIIIKIYYKI